MVGLVFTPVYIFKMLLELSVLPVSNSIYFFDFDTAISIS